MKKVSLTDFVDFVSSAGTPRATKVRNIKNRGPYHPAQDYYKQLREGIINIHESNKPKKDILSLTTNNPKRVNNYTSRSHQYYSWWGKKKMTWFTPPHGSYEQHDVAVSINPELGIDINGIPHLVKLYFKNDPLTKNKVDIITNLMEKTLTSASPPNTKMAVLDINNKKLFVKNVDIVEFDMLLSAELAYLSAYLNQ